MRCCPLNTMLPLHSGTCCHCDHLHGTEPTRSANIPASSTNWTQRVTKKKRRECEGVRRHAEGTWRKVEGELGLPVENGKGELGYI